MVPVLAEGSPKAALIVDVLVELFGTDSQPGMEMSNPRRSGLISDPFITDLGDTFPLLEREASARHLLTALRCTEARIRKAEEQEGSNFEEGVAFAGQCWVPD